MLMQLLWVILISIVVLFIYTSIRKSVSKAMKQKETNLDTDLREFRESHAVASVIRHGALDIQESIVQKYERMCILDPVANKNDPCIPKLISDYQDIILGRVLDPEGLNIPSEELLDVRNPDYARYLANQSKKQRKASLPDSAAALSKERARVLTATKGENLTNDIFAEIVMQGVPPVLAKAALTEGKLNTYTADDWKTFSKMVTEYLTVAERGTVESFVSMFDEQEVIFNAGTFEKFALFHKHGVPAPILTEIIRERITIDQAVRIVSIVQECEYSWEEGMNEILAEDLKENEAGELRKRYGWKG